MECGLTGMRGVRSVRTGHCLVRNKLGYGPEHGSPSYDIPYSCSTCKLPRTPVAPNTRRTVSVHAQCTCDQSYLQGAEFIMQIIIRQGG